MNKIKNIIYIILKYNINNIAIEPKNYYWQNKLKRNIIKLRTILFFGLLKIIMAGCIWRDFTHFRIKRRKFPHNYKKDRAEERKFNILIIES